MNKHLIITLLVVCPVLGYAQFASNSANASYEIAAPFMKWDLKVHDFGKIEAGTPATADFVLHNQGTKPIMILEVKAQCGCTIASYPKEAILPGETGTIKATYNAAASGVFHKSISVYTNVETEPMILVIKGEVAKL